MFFKLKSNRNWFSEKYIYINRRSLVILLVPVTNCKKLWNVFRYATISIRKIHSMQILHTKNGNAVIITHWGRKNGRDGADAIWNVFSWMKLPFFITLSLKFVYVGPEKSNSALVRLMFWRCTGAKALPEPIVSQFSDPYMILAIHVYC